MLNFNDEELKFIKKVLAEKLDNNKKAIESARYKGEVSHLRSDLFNESIMIAEIVGAIDGSLGRE